MVVPLLDLSAQYRSIQVEINEAVQSVFASQRFILGPEVQAFEEEIAAYLGVRHTIGVASGTDALLLPLKALGAKPGSHVIVPSFTFFATAGAVWNAGLRPVFCDVDPGTFNVTVETLDAVRTENTVAVIPVHLFGMMAPMTEINDWAQSQGIFVLEDCAQSIGATAPAGSSGTLGAAGAFSFFPSKNLGGYGDGGLVSTNDSDLAARLRRLRVHGGKKMYHHEMVGTNSRLDALQAAILRVKLRHLDGWCRARRENAARYRLDLAATEQVLLPQVPEGHTHVFNQFTIRVAERRDALREHLIAQEVGVAVYYPVPLHQQECFSNLGYQETSFPATERLCQEVLSIPIFPELGEERQDHVIHAIQAFFD